MSTDLIPYRNHPLSLRERRTAAEVRDARLPARRAGVRVDAARLVASVGLANVEMLTAEEVEIARRQGPVVDERARSIVDSYCRLVVTELNRLAMRGE